MSADTLTARTARDWRQERARLEAPRHRPNIVPLCDSEPHGVDAESFENALARCVPETAATTAPADALPLVAASSLADKAIPARAWHVRDLIPGRTVTVLSGDGGVGKSLLAMQLAVATVAGKPWIGTSPETGPGVYVSAEDDLDELHRRLADIAIGLGVELAELGGLHIVPLAGRDAVMGAPDGKSGVIKKTAVYDALQRIVARAKPRLVIIDTLADAFAGNENDRSHARQFIGLLRGLAIEHNLAVLLLSHPSLTGMGSGSGLSGSTAWNNSVRSRLYLERIKSEDGREVDADLRVLRGMKANYAKTGGETRLRWSNGQYVLDGDGGGSFDKLAADAKAESVFLDLLADYIKQDRRVSSNVSNAYAPSVFAKHPDAKGVSKRSFELAMERLFKSNRIATETVGPPSHQRSKIVLAPADVET